MGCIPCGSGGSTVNVTFAPSTVRQLSEAQSQTGDNCEYTQSLLIEWKRLLECVKSNNIFDIYGVNHVRVNSYIGIVQSALNYKTYPCYFAPQLDGIKELITAIQTSNQC